MAAAFLKKVLNTAALLTLMTGAGAAFAHAHLEQATPAADSTVNSVNELRLVFSEGVEQAFTQVVISHDQAPVPVSQEFLPSPGVGENWEAVIWA